MLILSSGCHHMLEDVPHCSSLLSSQRLPRMVAVVLFVQGVAHWMEHFLTAPMIQLISLSCLHVQFDIRVARARIWTTFFWENKLRPFSVAKRVAFSGRLDALSVPSSPKTPCLRHVPPIFIRQDPMTRRSVVILMGTH